MTPAGRRKRNSTKIFFMRCSEKYNPDNDLLHLDYMAESYREDTKHYAEMALENGYIETNEYASNKRGGGDDSFYMTLGEAAYYIDKPIRYHKKVNILGEENV